MVTKYRYIICNTWDGKAYGTNEPDVIAAQIRDTDNFIIDIENNLSYDLDTKTWIPVLEADVIEDDEDADS